MKSLLALIIGIAMTIPVVAGDNKSCAQSKSDASCCEKAKAAECSKAKSSCCAKEAAALRAALLTHKGASIVQR